jgi:hypothetical protein
MPAMPSVSGMPEFLLLYTLGRMAIAGFVSVATILTAACLTLQALTVLDRRTIRRRHLSPAGQRARPLFLPVEISEQ